MIGFLWVFGFSFYVVAFIGPSLWLAGSSVWVLVERWMVARRRSQAVPSSDGAILVSPTKSESGATIFSCVALGLPMLAFLLGAWQYQRGGWVFAEQVLAAATVCCAIIWLRLRRRGTRNAEVHAMAIWILTCIGWSVMIALDGPASFGTRWTLGGGTIGGDYGIYNLFGGKTLTVVSATWALVVVIAALVLARLRRPPIEPFRVILLALPYLCVFWFTEAMGWFHMALAMAVIGFALSREVRRIEDERTLRGGVEAHAKPNRFSLSGSSTAITGKSWLLSCAALLITVLTVAVGVACSLSSSIEVGYRFAIFGIALLASGFLQYWIFNRLQWLHIVWKWVAMHLVTSMAVVSATYALAAMGPGFAELQALTAGGIALVALGILALSGNDRKYGAMLLGSTFTLMLVYTFDTQGVGSVGPPWTFVQFAGTSVAAVATLVIMWGVYGPKRLEAIPDTSASAPAAVDGLH